MLETLNKFDHECSKRIFQLDMKNPFNWIIYSTSLVYMEEAVVLTVVLYHFLVFKSLSTTAKYILTLLLNLMVTVITKKVFGRTRPSQKELTKSTKTSFFRKKQSNGSLPSGDCMQGFAFATFAILYCEQWVVILGCVLAIMIAFGRVYVGCHYIGDVTFGAFFGIFVTWSFVQLALESVALKDLFSYLE